MRIDADARAYIDAIAARHRPLFDRVHHLVVTTHPEVAVGLAYKMPVYRSGRGRLHVGVWSHGLSIYGWPQGSETPFTDRHPALKASRGTIRIGPGDAGAVTDDDLLVLIDAALDR